MKAIERKYLLPFILVTCLFALWGLANNMTDTLLAAFRKIMQMSDTQTSFIQMAFYGVYFCIALSAAKAGRYSFYLIAIYILAATCSVLETTVNPYIMGMDSVETATRRLNIAQSFDPIGSILGILVSKIFILQDISLMSIRGTYAGVGVVLLAIMVAMLLARMLEGKEGHSALDAESHEIAGQARNEGTGLCVGVGCHRLPYLYYRFLSFNVCVHRLDEVCCSSAAPCSRSRIECCVC